MKWHVGIEGPGAVLDQLAIVVSDHDIRLDAHHGRGVLSASRLDSLDDVGSVRREAERIVAVMSACARLLLHSPESLKVRHVTGAFANGVDESAPFAWRQSSLFQGLRLALDSPTLEAALRLRNADRLDWTVVTEICEVIEAAAGGTSAIVRLSGVPERVIRQLCAPTARDAVGPDAAERSHEHELTGQLTFPEALELLDRLLVTWLSAVTRQSRGRR
jgi:hypothetical protein